jgi:hypothetical protein
MTNALDVPLELDATHRRYLMIDQGVGAIIATILINALIAWLLFRSLPVVPLWGQQSIAGDTIATTFFLPLFTCLIVTPLTHLAVRRGQLSRPSFRRASYPWLRWLPAGTFLRGLVLGLVVMIVVGPVSVWALAQLGVFELRFWPFVVFKALYAGALAAPVAPLIAVAALGDVQDRSVSGSR